MTSPSILAINAGSSTIRFAAIDTRSGERWLDGEADKLGTPDATFIYTVGEGDPEERSLPTDASLEDALRLIHEAANSAMAKDRHLVALAHRVVHGGSALRAPVVVNDEVLQQIEACIPMAPQHNPIALKQIRVAQELFPELRHIACFDTAFHASIPRRAYLYALPLSYLEERGVRRYGFHGFSHQRAAQEVAKALDKPLQRTTLISAHLGNGCSVNATQGGESLDNSMGFTPMEGIAMGSRSGDVDPGLFGYLHREYGMELDEFEHLLNKESGLQGLSGISNDMRVLRQSEHASNPRLDLALEVFSYRLAKGIAAARVALDDLDAIAFTGGIGANDADTRSRVVRLLDFLGCELDELANRNHGRNTGGRISPSDGLPALFAIPVNEEAAMVEACQDLV